jgi:hypothetical protein
MSEIQAIKIEVSEAIKRRLNDDGRSPAALYGITTVALAELVADITFAAAKDQNHARKLLNIIIALIEARWRERRKEGT